MEHVLEVRRRPMGFGISTQRYPKSRHFVARVGRVESRLIVMNGARMSGWSIGVAVLGGLVLR